MSVRCGWCGIRMRARRWLGRWCDDCYVRLFGSVAVCVLQERDLHQRLSRVGQREP